jgi:hypothetical protein
MIEPVFRKGLSKLTRASNSFILLTNNLGYINVLFRI